jgi:hypothetical protein
VVETTPMEQLAKTALAQGKQRAADREHRRTSRREPPR